MKSGKVLETDAALFAAGRRAAVDGLALEKAGLSINDRGYIPVDEHYRTTVSHVYAAGDVIGFPALASTSMEQGRVAVCHAFHLKYKERVASLLPMGIYTIRKSPPPEKRKNLARKRSSIMSLAGLFTKQCAWTHHWRHRRHAETHFARADRKLLGVSIIGENATELIHIGMMVLDNGLTIDEFIEQVFNYPRSAKPTSTLPTTASATSRPQTPRRLIPCVQQHSFSSVFCSRFRSFPQTSARRPISASIATTTPALPRCRFCANLFPSRATGSAILP